MKRSLLDTDTLSYYLKGEPNVTAQTAAYLAVFGKLDFSIVMWRSSLQTAQHPDSPAFEIAYASIGV